MERSSRHLEGACKHNMKKRMISILLTAVLCVGLLPTTAFASKADNSTASLSNTYTFKHDGTTYILALAAYYKDTGFDLMAPLMSGGEEFWIMDDIPLEERVSSTRYPVVFTCNEGSTPLVSVDGTLTAAIGSVDVRSSAPEVISVEAGSKNEQGYPIVKRYYEEAGEAVITTTVKFNGVEWLTEPIVLQWTDRVVNTDPLEVYLEKGSELAKKLSSAKGFNAYLQEHAGTANQLYLHLYEGFSVEGTIYVPDSMRIFGHGATIKGNLVITRGAIIENGDLVEPYPATVILDGLNFVQPENGKYTAAIAGAGATLGLSRCSITGYDVGVDTTYNNSDGVSGGLSLDMSGNTFVNNKIAVDIKTSLLGRRFCANVFEGNNVALRLSDDAGSMLYAATFYNCVFKKNATIVRNETSGAFHMPRCLYLNHKDQAVMPSPRKFVCTNRGSIFYAPYYYKDHPDIHDPNRAFSYQGQTITGGHSNFDMKQSVASADIHTGELEAQLAAGTVVIGIKDDEEQELYHWQISAAEEIVQPVQTYGLRLMALEEAEEDTEEVLTVASGGSFNPVVEINPVDDHAQIVTVGKFEFTEDSIDAVLSIPADGNTAPVLLRNGEIVPTTSADGKVSFTVSESGKYLLAYGDFTVAHTDATCTTDGYWTYVSAEAKYTETAEAATGHDFSNIFRDTCANCSEPNPNYVPSYIPPVSAVPESGEEPEPAPEPTPETPANPFSDIAESDYYYDAVLWAVSRGVTSGQTTNTFAPLLDCTRAQAVTFLWRAVGSPEPVGAGNAFTDVESGSYYEKAVQWAVENGIINGTGSNGFGTDAAVTRAQVVTFLWRAAGSPVVDADNCFDDIAENTYYSDAVRWAVKNGITLGSGANTFSPEDVCTREQVVTFLYRYCTANQ